MQKKQQQKPEDLNEKELGQVSGGFLLTPSKTGTKPK